MKVAFLTEMNFEGKIPETHPNMRTEFSWMYALDATHHCIYKLDSVVGYDHVFVIFPKGRVFLSAEGSKISNDYNPISPLLQSDFMIQLKRNNTAVHYVQEGPHWWFNDYEISDQIYFYNFLQSCDSIFAHNETDVNYYKGLFPNKKVRTIGTLMIDTLIKDIQPTKENKVIIGGNFARWYGGFESYMIATEFGIPIWAQTSHAMRENETHIDGLNHLPRVLWVDWMSQLASFKYGVHMMPTVAAGTFSLNCAYFGIPCIGNEDVDTQKLCHPMLSVKIDDVETARKMAIRLRDDSEFYNECSRISKENYKKYYSEEIWLETMKMNLNN
jgi:hypothetical protein